MIVSSKNLHAKDFETEKGIRTTCVKGSAIRDLCPPFPVPPVCSWKRWLRRNTLINVETLLGQSLPVFCSHSWIAN